VHAEAGKAVVTNCFQGYNSCIFAYGQTGSGKTHTMLGELAANHSLGSQSGLMPRIFDHLLREMHRRSAESEAGATIKFELDLSMLEIYNETIMDLLRPEASNLAIREDQVQGVHVEGVSQRRVHSGAPSQMPLQVRCPASMMHECAVDNSVSEGQLA
jgi:Kinesin motor domain